MQKSDFNRLGLISLMMSSRILLSRPLKKPVWDLLGRLLFLSNNELVQKSRENIQKAFKERFSPEEIDRVILGSLSGRMFDHLLIAPPTRIVDSVKIIGLRKLEDSLSKQKGAILWEPGPFGFRDLMKHCLKKMGYSLALLQSDVHFTDSSTLVSDKIVKKVLSHLQHRFLSEIIVIPRSGSLAYARKTVDHLRKNGVIAINGSGAESLTQYQMDFLGKQHTFSTGPFYLSRMAGVAVLPAFCVRNSDSSQFAVVIEDPITSGADSDSDDVGSVRKCVELFQRYVEAYPDHFWAWGRDSLAVSGYDRKSFLSAVSNEGCM